MWVDTRREPASPLPARRGTGPRVCCRWSAAIQPEPRRRAKSPSMGSAFIACASLQHFGDHLANRLRMSLGLARCQKRSSARLCRRARPSSIIRAKVTYGSTPSAPLASHRCTTLRGTPWSAAARSRGSPKATPSDIFRTSKGVSSGSPACSVAVRFSPYDTPILPPRARGDCVRSTCSGGERLALHSPSYGQHERAGPVCLGLVDALRFAMGRFDEGSGHARLFLSPSLLSLCP